jgi:hypothetical protein
MLVPLTGLTVTAATQLQHEHILVRPQVASAVGCRAPKKRACPRCHGQAPTSLCHLKRGYRHPEAELPG